MRQTKKHTKPKSRATSIGSKRASEPARAKKDYEDDGSLAWLAAHLRELSEDYPNRWVLIARDRVVAASTDPTALERKADEEGIQIPFITRIGSGPITWTTA